MMLRKLTKWFKYSVIYICRWRCDGTVDVQNCILCEQFLSVLAQKQTMEIISARLCYSGVFDHNPG